MPEKIKLDFVSDVYFYKCAYVEDDWEEKYKGNETVLSLISKLVSAETPKDDGIAEAMEKLIGEIGGEEETYLTQNGEFSVDGETLGDIEEYDDDEDLIYEIYEGSLYLPGNLWDIRDVYESQVKKSKVCVLETTQNKKHIATLEIDEPFDAKKLKYKDGWIEYDGKPFESEESRGNAIHRDLLIDQKVPGALDYIAEVRDGKLVIGSEYIELLGVEEGTKYEIKLGRKQIRLVPETDEDEDEYEDD
jgi:hypothetical protein